MSGPFLRFEDGKISLGGKDLAVQSANLSIAPTLEPERVYGDYDASIAGAKTEFINFAPTQNLKGQLDISFYISAETFAQDGSPNSIDRMFEIKNGMSEQPINQNVVGRYRFDNMYLTSFSFSLSPLQVIQANATYDIYGSINRTIDRRFHKDTVDFAHAMKSFGRMEASGTDIDVATQRQFEISSLKYNIIVGRKIYNTIRAAEHTSTNTNANGVVPARVSVENIEAEMNIESNEMIPLLNAYGDRQALTSPESIADSEVEAFLYDLQGNKIARFPVVGKIQSQSSSISEGDYAKSSITIKQIIK
jgi:hypothetical protein